MGAIIDILQSFLILFLMIMLLVTQRRISRLQYQPTRTIYQTLPSPPEEKAVCGCEHHKCFHDENGCGHTLQIYEANSYHPIAETHCGCKGYMGPEHLPSVIP